MNVHAHVTKANMLIGGDLVAGQANNWIDLSTRPTKRR